MKLGVLGTDKISTNAVQIYIEEKQKESTEKLNQLITSDSDENKEFETIEFQNIYEAVVALKNDELDEAIVPIENSIQGSIIETIDSLIENDGIYVNGELILNEDQNGDSKQVKFWILSKEKDMESKFPEEIDKMSIIFSTKDEPGALYQILGIFNFNKINLTKIESRPAKTVLGDYIFIVDLIANENIDTVLRLLEEECKYLKILGRY